MPELTLKFYAFSKYLCKHFFKGKFYILELLSKACLLPSLNQAAFLGIRNLV